jgi:hypothetical protein
VHRSLIFKDALRRECNDTNKIKAQKAAQESEESASRLHFTKVLFAYLNKAGILKSKAPLT